MKKVILLLLGFLVVVNNAYARHVMSWCNMDYRIKNNSNHNILIREYSAGGEDPNNLSATPDIYVNGNPQISCMTRNCISQVVAPGQDFSLGQFQTSIFCGQNCPDIFFNRMTQVQYVISDTTMPTTFFQSDTNGNPIYDQSVAVVSFNVDAEPSTNRCRYNVSVHPLIASNVTNKIAVCYMNMGGGNDDNTGLVGYNTWVTYDVIGGSSVKIMQIQYFNNLVPSQSTCTKYPWSSSSLWSQPYNNGQ